MKRTIVNFIIAGVFSLSTVGGLAVLLTGGPVLGDVEQTQHHIDSTPILIAQTPINTKPAPKPKPGPDNSTNGNSWGG